MMMATDWTGLVISSLIMGLGMGVGMGLTSAVYRKLFTCNCK